MKIYATNLGRYVEGDLVGEWVSLPLQEDLQDILKRNGYDSLHEEFFITDFEQNYNLFDVGEYTSIERLSEMCEFVQNLSEYELEMLCAYTEVENKIENLKDLEDFNFDYFILYEGQSMEDVAYELAHECYPDFFENSNLSYYFDYNAFARDLSFDGYQETTYGVLYAC